MSELQKQYMAESGKRPTYSLGYTNSYIDWLENRITTEEKLQAKIDYLDERLIELSDENTSLLPKNLALQAEVERLRDRVSKSSNIMRSMADRLEQKSRWDIHDRKAVLNLLRANAVINDRALAEQEGDNEN